ncbi:alpha/beta fold hydrolase [Halostella sp. PRR32]|uniref:alpha/beta fold hydrolase n=1 Tax=Halostella sp. PRR32 TaxID=3098147 RepID=UPI002B1E4366|nr:alpha/beta fold hydrolase [Halostella sp. PRR32]
MEQRTFDDGGDEDLVFVLVWGNKLYHENVRWLIDELTGAGYRVHAFRIPTAISDFRSEYLEPVAEFVAELDGYRLLSHSTGGLIAAHLDGADRRIYLSPFWGFPEGVLDVLGPLFAKLPTSVEFLPANTDAENIGDLATDRQIATGANAAAPSWIRECREAQRTLPPIDDDAVVFCTLRDRIVSTRAIGDRVPPERIVLYDGGHELFSSSARDRHLDTLLAALEDGSAALSA